MERVELTNPEVTPNLVEQIRLATGDRVEVTTLMGFVYLVEAGQVEAGLLLSRITRMPTNEVTPAKETYEKAAIISNFQVNTIVRGETMSFFGLNAATNKRDARQTTQVVAISVLENQVDPLLAPEFET